MECIILACNDSILRLNDQIPLEIKQVFLCVDHIKHIMLKLATYETLLA